MTEFDFEKRTVPSPYTVPDGFFERMEERVAASVAVRRRERAGYLPPRLRYAAAAAVAALVVGTAALFQPASEASDGYDEIARLFQQMSPDDQNSMLDSYSDDVFINY